MIHNYEIFVDSSADMAQSLIEKYKIHVVPMSYSIGSENCVCLTLDDDASRIQFYKQQREGQATHTSQVSTHQYIDAFSPALKGGQDVLYLSLSGGLTNSIDSIRLAKQILSENAPNAYVYELDSLSATSGIGLLAEVAGRNRETGMSIEENVAVLKELRHEVCHVFAVDDLMYLKRGGRVPTATAVVGTALNIKPILVIDEAGKLQVIDKKRGTKAVIRNILERYSQSHRTGCHSIHIVHGDAPELASQVADAFRELDAEAQISIGMLSPVIGAHTGPGLLAVIYWGKRDKMIS